MGSVNKVILVGNLGRDAELRYTASGHPVAGFSMATTEKWTDKNGQRQEKTEWHAVNVWGKTAEALTEYLTKGKSIYVEGRLETRTWEKDGVKHYKTEVKADRVVLLGGGNGKRDDSRDGWDPAATRPGRTAAERVGDPRGELPPAPADEDDIPF